MVRFTIILFSAAGQEHAAQLRAAIKQKMAEDIITKGKPFCDEELKLRAVALSQEAPQKRKPESDDEEKRENANKKSKDATEKARQ